MTFSLTAIAGTPQNNCFDSFSCRHNSQHMETPPAEHNAEGTAHHVHHTRTARTQGRSRQNVSRRPRRAEAEAPAERGAAEDPRNRHPIGRAETAPKIPMTDHAEPIRAEMLTGCRSHRRSHSPRSHHKTRRALYCCISEQIPTAGANAPQNAIHGAGANHANLTRWTETHRAPLKRRTSRIEPFLSILRTFTHRQIKRAQNVKIALTPTKLIGESIQSISRRS